MARRSTKRPEVKSLPVTLTHAEMRAGISRLEKRIAELRGVDVDGLSSAVNPDIQTLENAIDRLLAKLFGIHSPDYNRYKVARFINFRPTSYRSAPSVHEIQSQIKDNIERSISVLEGLVASFKEDLEEDEDTYSPSIEAPKRDSRKIFVVHGRDEAVRETVARFLEFIDMEPIILNEQVSRNRTIIEMIETFGDQVGFAVVLLTPDDIGAAGTSPEALQPRARQNVILELGYFIGKLGRDRVCALRKSDTEVPSDYDGVLYTPLDDAGGWRVKLAQELHAAGVDIDFNKVMRR